MSRLTSASPSSAAVEKPLQLLEQKAHPEHDDLALLPTEADQKRWEESPGCHSIKRFFRKFFHEESVPRPPSNKIIAFVSRDKGGETDGVCRLAYCDTLLTLDKQTDCGYGPAGRIMVCDPSHTANEKSLLADQISIESVPYLEAILAIDRRSLVVDAAGGAMPIMDIIADFPEKPAIIVTNRFAEEALRFVGRAATPSHVWEPTDADDFPV